MSEWWINNSGQNLLRGLTPPEDFPENPAMIDDTTILDWLNRIPDALSSFERLFPNMSTAEQTRLARIRALVTGRDESRRNDEFQSTWNRKGVSAIRFAGKGQRRF
jgi:hypothetical protein